MVKSLPAEMRSELITVAMSMIEENKSSLACQEHCEPPKKKNLFKKQGSKGPHSFNQLVDAANAV